MIKIAERSLELYYFLFERLYGVVYCSINVHSLIHYVFYVRRFGPLWTASCFPFEHIIGVLVKTLSGTNNVVDHMVYSFTMIRNLEAALMQLPPSYLSRSTRSFLVSCGVDFGKEENSLAMITKSKVTRFGSSYAIGDFNPLFDPEVFDLFETAPSDCQGYDRIFHCGQVVHSRKYARGGGNSYTASFTDQTQQLRFASIDLFVCASFPHRQPIFAAIARPLFDLGTNLFDDPYQVLQYTNASFREVAYDHLAPRTAIPVSSIGQLVMLLQVGVRQVVTEFVNKY
jgi:hypothetical protein